MKFDCGPTWAEEKAAKEKWHSWFAWHPVRVGSHDCRWLETIERKGVWFGARAGWSWKYRAKENADD